MKAARYFLLFGYVPISLKYILSPYVYMLDPCQSCKTFITFRAILLKAFWDWKGYMEKVPNIICMWLKKVMRQMLNSFLSLIKKKYFTQPINIKITVSLSIFFIPFQPTLLKEKNEVNGKRIKPPIKIYYLYFKFVVTGDMFFPLLELIIVGEKRKIFSL